MVNSIIYILAIKKSLINLTIFNLAINYLFIGLFDHIYFTYGEFNQIYSLVNLALFIFFMVSFTIFI
jgi:hypothetical protein